MKLSKIFFLLLFLSGLSIHTLVLKSAFIVDWFKDSQTDIAANRIFNKFIKKASGTSSVEIIGRHTATKRYILQFNQAAPEVQTRVLEKMKDFRDSQGNTILHFAAQAVDWELMKFCIQKENELQLETVKNEQGRLYMQELPYIESFLKDNKAKVWAKDCLYVLKNLLQRKEYYLNNVDSNGQSLIDLLISQNNTTLSNFLLSIKKSYSDPSYKSAASLRGISKAAEAAAFVLAQKYKKDWENELIRHKDALNDFAVNEGITLGALEELYKKVARVHEREQPAPDIYLVKNGDSLLYQAVEKGDLKLVKQILGRKDTAVLIVTPNYANRLADEYKGFTPLHLAAYNNAFDILETLLKYAPQDDNLNVTIVRKRQKVVDRKNKEEMRIGIVENMLHVLIKNMYKDILRYIESKETILDKTFKALSLHQSKYIKQLLEDEKDGVYTADMLPLARRKGQSYFMFSLTTEQVEEINKAIAKKIADFSKTLE